MNGPQLIRVRDRVADQLVSRRAISPATATAYQPKTPLERWLFARRRKSGAIVETRPGHFYLDVAAYHAEAFAWERRAVPIALGAIAFALLLMLFYRGGLVLD